MTLAKGFSYTARRVGCTACVLSVWLHHKYLDVGSAVDCGIICGCQRPIAESTRAADDADIDAARTGMDDVPQTVRGRLKRVYHSDDRAQGKMHIVFIQTGGTIDKDYPRRPGVRF